MVLLGYGIMTLGFRLEFCGLYLEVLVFFLSLVTSHWSTIMHQIFISYRLFILNEFRVVKMQQKWMNVLQLAVSGAKHGNLFFND